MASLFRRQNTEVKWPAATQEGVQAFKEFYDSETLQEALETFKRVCDGANVSRGGRFIEFFPYLKAAYKDVLPYKYKEIWKILEKKAGQSLYERNTIGQGDRNRVLVIGAGPVGLRSAIEAQLLGARVVVIERRPRFTRNNVLKLWKFLIDDLKLLGAKKFYGKFATGSINHINIRSLQLILTKISLMLGVIIYAPCKFVKLAEPALTEEGSLNPGWQAVFEENKEAEGYIFDVIIGASGKNCVLDGFNRYSLDARLAIAITANFVNRWTSEEQAVEEIGGLSRQYDQDFFKDMHTETGVDLENIVYYKDQVHYFVMTAKKESLLKEGVLKEDIPDDDGPGGRGKILHPSNVDKEKLMEYAKKAALFSTERRSRKLPHTDWVMLPRGENGTPDCCIFDFTNLYAARVAARVQVRKGQPLLSIIVGDSLLEPFWPEGTGCARGFLSALDAGWMIRDWFLGKKNPLKILAEREMTRSILNQTTDGNLVQKFKNYTLDPTTRYKVIPKKYDKEKIMKYYDSDNPDELQFLQDRFKEKKFFDNAQHKGILKSFRAKFKKEKKSEAKEKQKA